MSKYSKFVVSPISFLIDSNSLVLRMLGRSMFPFRSDIEALSLRLLGGNDLCVEKGRPVVGSRRSLVSRGRSAVRRYFISRKGNPHVSVIMAAHKAESTISESIESLLNQAYPFFALIIVIDGDVDGTLKICRDYARRDNRITIMVNAENRGVAYSRNRALAVAKTRFVTFNDADDISSPYRLDTQLHALLRRKGKVVSSSLYVRVDESLEPYCVDGKLLRKCMASIMMDWDRVKKAAGYLLEIPVGEDSEYYRRIKLVFGEECEIFVVRCLYYALYREGSLNFCGRTIIRKTRKGVSLEKSSDAVRIEGFVGRVHRAIISGHLDGRVDRVCQGAFLKYLER